MIKSIWQSNAFFFTAKKSGFYLFMVMIMPIRNKTKFDYIVWFVMVFVFIFAMLFMIKAAINYKNIYNFVQGNGEHEFVDINNCNVEVESIMQVYKYKISIVKEIRGIEYELFDMFLVNPNKKKKFDAFLQEKRTIEFVYNKKNPRFNLIQKNEDFAQYDSLSQTHGWRDDKYSIILVVGDILLIIVGTVLLFLR